MEVSFSPPIIREEWCMQKFKRIVDAMDRTATWITYISVTVMVLMVALQVISRYVFHNSISFSEELARYMFIWTVAIGSSMALKSRSHVSVGVFVDALPAKAGKIIKPIADLLAVFFFSLLFIFGVVMVFKTRTQTTPALGMSMGLVYLSIPVGAVILIIDGIYNACMDFLNPEILSKEGEL